MNKPAPSSKKPRSAQPGSHSKSEHKAAIKATLESLDAIEAETPKAAKLLALLRSWMTDESGYDERTWPKLQKALDEERDRARARRLFDG